MLALACRRGGSRPLSGSERHEFVTAAPRARSLVVNLEDCHPDQSRSMMRAAARIVGVHGGVVHRWYSRYGSPIHRFLNFS